MCFNDEVALGAMLAAEELGLRPGVDVAITGWDDVMAARYARPALTTVRQPMRELGAQAAAALDERISGARTELIHRVLPTDLLIRDSCGGRRAYITFEPLHLAPHWVDVINGRPDHGVILAAMTGCFSTGTIWWLVTLHRYPANTRSLLA